LLPDTIAIDFDISAIFVPRRHILYYATGSDGIYVTTFISRRSIAALPFNLHIYFTAAIEAECDAPARLLQPHIYRRALLYFAGLAEFSSIKALASAALGSRLHECSPFRRSSVSFARGLP
jgi:hypothetical protein